MFPMRDLKSDVCIMMLMIISHYLSSLSMQYRIVSCIELGMLDQRSDTGYTPSQRQSMCVTHLS